MTTPMHPEPSEAPSPAPCEPGPAAADPTVPEPTVPEPTVPEPTVPEPTVPEPAGGEPTPATIDAQAPAPSVTVEPQALADVPVPAHEPVPAAHAAAEGAAENAPAAEGAAENAPAADVAAAQGQAAATAAGTPADPGQAQASTMTLADCATELTARFPALFTPGSFKPLKLKIQADIQARAPGVFTRKLLSAFLHRHTTSTAYLRAMAEASHRHDLDGAQAGELAAEHREAAAKEAERRRAIVQERRKAEAQARRAAQRGQGPSGPEGQGPAPEGDAPGGQPDRRAGRRASPGGQRRPQQPPRGDRRPARGDDARQGPRPERSRNPTQAGRREGRPMDRQHPGPGRTGPGQDLAASEPATPMDPERRARQALLRAWETTTLSPANFLVLQRLTQAQLDEALTLARAERGGGRDAGPRRR